MKPFRLAAISLLAAATLFTAGCAQHPYYSATPPPAAYYQSAPLLVERAEREGFRAGSENGARDLYNGFGHHPQHDRSYHDTPGYDPALGPYGPYRDAFRRSYLRGYDQSFYRR